MGGILGKMSRLSLAEDVSQKRNDVNVNSIVNENFKTPKRSFIAEHLLDPRSASQGIKRTPLILNEVVEENKRDLTDTPVKPKPYLETDLDEAYEAVESGGILPEVAEDVLVSEEKETLNEIPPEHIPECDRPITPVRVEEEIVQEEIEDLVDLSLKEDPGVDSNSDDEIITIEGKIKNSPALRKVKKTIVYKDNVPPSESTPVKPKNGRTPLALVSNNSSPLPSPLGGGSKAWRGFHEERIRLGLENTPPSTGPYLESVQSAPGKVGGKKSKKSFARANWAQDESLII